MRLSENERTVTGMAEYIEKWSVVNRLIDIIYSSYIISSLWSKDGGGERMKINPNKPISGEILDVIEWISSEDNSEYEKGILTGLRIAECIAEAVERNSEVSE